MQSATLTVGEYVSLSCGKGHRSNPGGDSHLIRERHDNLDLTFKGQYTGARVRVMYSMIDQTESSKDLDLTDGGDSLSLDIPARCADAWVRLLAIASGAVEVGLESYRAASRAAPGASAARHSDYAHRVALQGQAGKHTPEQAAESHAIRTARAAG